MGGTPVGDPVIITSSPSTVTAIDGNNAHARLIIDGSQIDRIQFPDPTGSSSMPHTAP